MPGYKATVVGENFEFVIDDEPHMLEFSRTVYVDAEDASAAEAAALAQVREELLAQALLDESGEQLVTVDEVAQMDVLAAKSFAGDFIWYFPEEDFPDEED